MRFFHMYQKNQRCPTFIISFFKMLVVYIDRRIRIIGRQPVLSKCHALETSTIRRLCLQLMQNVGKNAMSQLRPLSFLGGANAKARCPTACFKELSYPLLSLV